MCVLKFHAWMQDGKGYPRGVAFWGFFDAIAGRVVDRSTGIARNGLPFAQIVVPLLDTADWALGVGDVIDNR